MRVLASFAARLAIFIASVYLAAVLVSLLFEAASAGWGLIG